jgi:L-lactate permease
VLAVGCKAHLLITKIIMFVAIQFCSLSNVMISKPFQVVKNTFIEMWNQIILFITAFIFIFVHEESDWSYTMTDAYLY